MVETSDGPLSGFKVVDFSRVLAGPHCGRMLVDMGAEVIKVEPPDGDILRSGKPRRNSLTPGFTHQNVGKRNISIDMKRSEGVDLARQLLTKTDVVLENFRPGVMAKMGLGYDAVAQFNPGVVYASISGYGQTGSWVHRRAYAPLVHAEMGYLDGTARYLGTEVRQEPMSHGDLYTGVHCCTAIVAALLQRERTGEGQHIDVAMAETMLFMNEHAATNLSGETEYLPTPNVASPIYKTSSGDRVMVSFNPAERGVFAQYLKAMEQRSLAEDPRFRDYTARMKHREELLAIIQTWILTFSDIDELEAALARGGLVMGKVRSLKEVAELPWLAERGAVAEVSDRGTGSFRIPNTPWRFSKARTGVRGAIAYRGEDNAEVLHDWLSLSHEEISSLEES
ncbi:MAG: CaiB/BaiF CoA transferase family protein, partial [Pseudomonadales bacterium]